MSISSSTGIVSGDWDIEVQTSCELIVRCPNVSQTCLCWKQYQAGCLMGKCEACVLRQQEVVLRKGSCKQNGTVWMILACIPGQYLHFLCRTGLHTLKRPDRAAFWRPLARACRKKVMDSCVVRFNELMNENIPTAIASFQYLNLNICSMRVERKRSRASGSNCLRSCLQEGTHLSIYLTKGKEVLWNNNQSCLHAWIQPSDLCSQGICSEERAWFRKVVGSEQPIQGSPRSRCHLPTAPLKLKRKRGARTRLKIRSIDFTPKGSLKVFQKSAIKTNFMATWKSDFWTWFRLQMAHLVLPEPLIRCGFFRCVLWVIKLIDLPPHELYIPSVNWWLHFF